MITPRGVWRRCSVVFKASSNIFNLAQSTVALILPSLYLHMMVPDSQAHCAVLLKTCFCFSFELAVPVVIDFCPTGASGSAAKHSVGKLNLKTVLITLFMICYVKGVARINEPTENYHPRLQLHSVVESLICLTNKFTVLVRTHHSHSVSLAAAGSCFLKTYSTLSAQQQMAHSLRGWALLSQFYLFLSEVLIILTHVKNNRKTDSIAQKYGFLRRKKNRFLLRTQQIGLLQEAVSKPCYLLPLMIVFIINQSNDVFFQLLICYVVYKY